MDRERGKEGEPGESKVEGGWEGGGEEERLKGREYC